MRIFQNLSIRNKLIGIILSVTILALGSGFTLVILNEIKTFRERMMNRTMVTAQAIGDYCVSPLAFQDRDGADSVLVKLAGMPSVVNAIVYDMDRNVFATFTRSENATITAPPVRERSSEFVDEYLHVFHPIFHRDEYYGTIYLRSSTESLNATIKEYMHHIVLLLTGLIVVSVFLALWLQRIISQPILNLAGVARQITEEGNYALRVQKKGNDETGFLYDGFNNMLEQIQNRETERDSAEDALRESERKFRTLTANIPGAVYRCAHDSDWTMDFISEEIEAISGYPASDFIQNSVRTYAGIIHPDDRKMVKETVQEGILERAPYIIEYRIVRSDGAIRGVYEKGQAIFSGDGRFLWLDGVIFDITERKQAEEELAKYQEHLEELVDTRTLELTDANKHLQQEVAERKRAEGERESLRRLSQRLTVPLTVKEVGRIVAEESRRLFGHDAFALDLLDASTQKLSGIYYEDTPSGASEPEEVPILQANELTTRERDVLAGRSELINRDKEPTDVQTIPFGYESRRSRSLMFVPICWEDRCIGILSVQSYTSDRYSERELEFLQTFADQCGGALARVRAEQELEATLAKLSQSEKMASLGMLVAGVAHEINTPVGAISSMHNTLVRAVEKLRSTLDRICSAESDEHRSVNKLFKILEDGNRVITSGTDRITNIVRRLKSFARLDESELQRVDIHEGIEDTLTIVHHELKHKAVVERHFGNIPPIACYPGQLNQVYVNLLINAVQAIKDKGTITITTFRKNGHVHIRIEDTGVGIPQELLGKIFDPGVTTKGVGVGTGLGLSICYQIIEDHHGEVLVESEVGKGTTFTVVLPMNLDEILSGA